MAVTDGAPLQLSEPAAAAAGTSSGPRAAPARRRAQATKRKRQASSEAPPAKRGSAASSLPAKKTAAKPAQRGLKGKAQKMFSRKKALAGASEKSQEQKPGVKTSSLFKNNPEIPELPRPEVKQVQEKVFSSDAFHELDLHPHLISTLNTVLNIFHMTSVQKQSIPALLEGRDALVRSQTGSGKTLAYCIPMVQSLQAMKTKIQVIEIRQVTNQHIEYDSNFVNDDKICVDIKKMRKIPIRLLMLVFSEVRGDGPYALVLVPTRELALQSFDTFQKLLKPFTWIVPGVLMGGEKRKSEKARLRKGINILISTPGRLVDHIKSTKNIHFNRIRWLVLDEADRILDLGFEKTITVILNAINAECQERQNVLLSATLTEGVTRLADISLHSPVSISVLGDSFGQPYLTDEESSDDSDSLSDDDYDDDDTDDDDDDDDDELDGFAIPEGLEQYVVLVPSKLRLVCLAAFILQKCKFETDQKLIVFFSSCELVEFHYHLFFQTLLGGAASGQSPSGGPRLTFLRLHGNMDQEERTAVFREFAQAGPGVLFCTDVAARGLDLPQVTWIVQYDAPSSAAEYIHRIGRTARIGCHGSSLLFLAPSEAEYVSSLASHKINTSEMKMDDILSVLTRDDSFQARRGGGQQPHAVGPQETQERATVLQTVFEDYVHSCEGTVAWAKRALQSFIRAYTTYPRSLKHIFHIRLLHLGHVAKSFGLRDAPQNLGGSTVKKRKVNMKRPDLRKRAQQQHLAEALRSEYASGLEAGGAKAKRQSRQAELGEPSSASSTSDA